MKENKREEVFKLETHRLKEIRRKKQIEEIKHNAKQALICLVGSLIAAVLILYLILR